MQMTTRLGLTLFAIAGALLTGCADPSVAEICGKCEDELEAECEDSYQVCLEADEGECFDALEEFYEGEC
jgi:hypothetical protein